MLSKLFESSTLKEGAPQSTRYLDYVLLLAAAGLSWHAADHVDSDLLISSENVLFLLLLRLFTSRYDECRFNATSATVQEKMEVHTCSAAASKVQSLSS